MVIVDTYKVFRKRIEKHQVGHYRKPALAGAQSTMPDELITIDYV